MWAPFDDVLLATIYPNGQAQATVFDQWFRRVAKHMGPVGAFGAGCAPDSPGRGVTDAVSGDWTACAPLAGTTEAASQLIGFDTPSGVGLGLTATVFAAPAAGLPSPFSGNPVAHGAADQDPDVGIPVAAVAPAAVSGSGLRLDGGLVVPTDAGTAADSWTLRVVAPADLVTSGVVMVDGEFCAVLDGGEGSCAVTPDANTRAQHFTVDVELARDAVAADRVTVELQDPLGDPPLVDNSFLVRRWSADTTLTRVDPVPAGSIAGWSDTFVTTHTYGCGTAADPPAAQVACVGSALSAVHDPGGLDLTYTYTYDADGFGGVRLVSATPPDGGEATVYEFWGPDETAAGLPNADQLGDLVAVPQRGLPKTTTLPGGRSTTTVHDDYGTPLCQQVDGGNWTCTTLDVTRRPVTHVVRANQAGVAAVTISTDYAPAGNPLINRTTRSDTTGATTTDQTVLAPSGRVLEYTDTLNTVTGYRYDGMGRLSSTTITPPATPGRKARPRPLGVTAGFTTTVTFDPATGLQTGVSLQGQPLAAIAYNNPDHRWLPTGYTYTLAGGAPSPPRSTTTRISTRSGGPGRSPTAANCWTAPPRRRPRPPARPPSVTPSRGRRPVAAPWPAPSTVTPTSSPMTPPAA